MLSIVVSSIVLSIGLSLFNIVQKELILSATGRDSQFAFYSADGGIECALYWDIKQLALPANLAESQGDDSPPEPVHTGTECGETDFSGGGGVWTASIADGVIPTVQASVDGDGNPVPASGYEDDVATYVLVITFQSQIPDSTPGSCAQVTITKKDNPSEGGYQAMTTIESKGYNDECTLDNPALVERAISVVY